MKSIQLLRPIDLHVRNIFRRKRHVEEVVLVVRCVGHVVPGFPCSLCCYFVSVLRGWLDNALLDVSSVEEAVSCCFGADDMHGRVVRRWRWCCGAGPRYDLIGWNILLDGGCESSTTTITSILEFATKQFVLVELIPISQVIVLLIEIRGTAVCCGEPVLPTLRIAARRSSARSSKVCIRKDTSEPSSWARFWGLVDSFFKLDRDEQRSLYRLTVLGLLHTCPRPAMPLWLFRRVCKILRRHPRS